VRPHKASSDRMGGAITNSFSVTHRDPERERSRLTPVPVERPGRTFLHCTMTKANGRARCATTPRSSVEKSHLVLSLLLGQRGLIL